MANVQRCALLGISDSWCIKPWARCSRIKVQTPPWFPSSHIACSWIVCHDPGRRSPTSFERVLSRWWSYNMMMSTSPPNINSLKSVLLVWLTSEPLHIPCYNIHNHGMRWEIVMCSWCFAQQVVSGEHSPFRHPIIFTDGIMVQIHSGVCGLSGELQ